MAYHPEMCLGIYILNTQANKLTEYISVKSKLFRYKPAGYMYFIWGLGGGREDVYYMYFLGTPALKNI